jgi:hypothetical protein
MGSDMIPVDELSPSQVEAEDYIRFELDGEEHEGVVLAIEDNGDTFTVTLSDDVEGDSVDYVIDSDTDISLMMYGAVAV